jgi:transcriptional regulator with XRE-family HTH domain
VAERYVAMRHAFARGALNQKITRSIIVGGNVRRIRLQRRMTQEKLAFEAELDLTYVGGIERGKRNPSLLVMARIARALSVPLGKLIAD